MRKRGQSAMEYITTYGWGVLIVTVIGIVLWQMGFFSVTGKIPPGQSGFAVVVPLEWGLVVSGGNTCSLELRVANGAAEELRSLEIDGTPCVPATVAAGNLSTCAKTINVCPDAGSPYEEDAIITYRRAADNQSFQSAGTVWGSSE